MKIDRDSWLQVLSSPKTHSDPNHFLPEPWYIFLEWKTTQDCWVWPDSTTFIFELKPLKVIGVDTLLQQCFFFYFYTPENCYNSVETLNIHHCLEKHRSLDILSWFPLNKHIRVINWDNFYFMLLKIDS